ncbi:hypothetical protein [Antarctobacter jejuensis]|uniref:hypothetical protein n=1 Tax=Antarctobacter jejuensis TaxID=1439938 RepID=UPI003FD190E8
MKKLSKIAILFAGLSQAASAQQTTQAEILGPSGDPVYSVQILGADGVTYDCRPETERTVNEILRYCRRVGAGTTGDSTQMGAAAAAGLILAIFAISSASGTN